jgi:hypothetical protein
MCHIFSILRELSYINGFPKWLGLEMNGDRHTECYSILQPHTCKTTKIKRFL